MKTKKYYVQPEAVVVKISTQFMLAQSGCGCPTNYPIPDEDEG